MYRIVLNEDGTGTSQMHDIDGTAINELYDLSYTIDGFALNVNFPHFGEPLAALGLPTEVETGEAIEVSLSGPQWLTDAFSATVDGDKKITGIIWAAAEFTCEPTA